MREKDSFPTSLFPTAKLPLHRPANLPPPSERSGNPDFSGAGAIARGLLLRTGRKCPYCL